MRILAIETSCDETAITVIDAEGDESSARFTIRGNALLSQVETHKEYGGVFPSLAKREHAKNLVPLLEAALEEAELLHEDVQAIPEKTRAKISGILAREPNLCEPFLDFVSESERPAIDAIAVTAGPGLEPALWVGVNFAKALALLWEKPLIAVNHMEGHVLSSFAKASEDRSANTLTIGDIKLPVLALLISGGHTELVLMKKWLEYELVGETRDDAVGEAFDKVARMLSLPYPGGPEISKLAEQARIASSQTAGFWSGNLQFVPRLPRPMIDSGTCDFSFAGLKTAVLYLLKEIPGVSEEQKKHIAHEFENAVADVLWAKTSRALEKTGAQTLVLGGGVSANTHIRRVFTNGMRERFPRAALRIPAAELTTDNAVMIGLAGFYRALRKEFVADIVADGTLSLCRRNS